MIHVIGGTYQEIDYDGISTEIFGSGFRATKFLLENKCPTKFTTVGNKETVSFLHENKKVYHDLELSIIPYDELITFKYSFALENPAIFPHILNLSKIEKIEVEDENVIAFGMLEANYNVIGEKVVYDPQTSIKPNKFSDFGKARQLIYIVNSNEAASIAGSENIDEIKNYFFEVEKVEAFIIKNGPYGATLYFPNKEVGISSYITDNVFKIGSGDIFTSSFGYYWMYKNYSIEEAVVMASKTTAIFCDRRAYVDMGNFEGFDFKEFDNKKISDKQVYLAAPIFALSELILIDKIRSAFLSFGIKVFSPYHDVGIGASKEIAEKDIEGINSSDIIFCTFDNLDSGTLIESGYALSKSKKIIGYHRTCDEDKFLMLKVANIEHYKHLTTAIYKTIWNL